MATILSEMASACADIKFAYSSNARCICSQSGPSTNQLCFIIGKKSDKMLKDFHSTVILFVLPTNEVILLGFPPFSNILV
jgi:hypothetical protein